MDDVKNGMLKPVDIKFRAQSIPWLELETAVNLDRMFCIASNKEPESLEQQLEVLSILNIMIHPSYIYMYV